MPRTTYTFPEVKMVGGGALRHRKSRYETPGADKIGYIKTWWSTRTATTTGYLGRLQDTVNTCEVQNERIEKWVLTCCAGLRGQV